MKEKIKKYCFIAFMADKFEFPLAVFDSCEELAKWRGRSCSSIRSALCRNELDESLQCRYKKVLILDENDVYQQKGFADRKDYLNYLSEKYDVSPVTVQMFAKMLGEDKDFSSLVEMIESLSKKKYKRRKL